MYEADQGINGQRLSIQASRIGGKRTKTRAREKRAVDEI